MSKPPTPEGAPKVLRPYRLAFTAASGRVVKKSYTYRDEWERRVANLRNHGILIEEETFDATAAAPAGVAGPQDPNS